MQVIEVLTLHWCITIYYIYTYIYIYILASMGCVIYLTSITKEMTTVKKLWLLEIDSMHEFSHLLFTIEPCILACKSTAIFLTKARGHDQFNVSLHWRILKNISATGGLNPGILATK